MSSLVDGLGRFWGWQHRVAHESMTGLANTAIDVHNAMVDGDAQLKPIDLDEDVYQRLAAEASKVIAPMAGAEQLEAAKDWYMTQTRAPETQAGQLGTSLSVWALGFLGGRKLIQTGVSKVAKEAAKKRGMAWAINTGMYLEINN